MRNATEAVHERSDQINVGYRSNAVIAWQSPSGPKSEPYGISAINDVIWYSESNATPNMIVRFDPKTSKFQSWPIPGGGNIVRNTSVTRDGKFVLANSLVNTVTLVTIRK
jgi:virginiamycin B lyase